MTQAALYNHTATLLKDGRVLVTGGQTMATGLFPNSADVVSAEIYDPSTGRWSPTSPMSDPRRHHGTVLLEDGNVLVAGGLTDEFGRSPESGHTTWVGSVASAEVYDPAKDTWSLVGDMPDETADLIGAQRNRPAILLEILENGQVLAIGGLGPSAAGLYDVSSGTWASADEPATSGEYPKRLDYTMALLGDGKVLFIGGWNGREEEAETTQMDSVELYDPLADSRSLIGSLIEARLLCAATILADGKVLVTGGLGRGFSTVASAEIYNPLTGTWSGAGEMAFPRYQHTMTLLSDGRVLVIGGGSQTPDIYDPSTSSWSKAVLTIERRQGHTATMLRDGRVLAVGGVSGSGRFPATSAEIYDPVADTWTPSTEAAR